MRRITFRAALTEALSEEMARDGRVFILGEDVSPIIQDIPRSWPI